MLHHGLIRLLVYITAHACICLRLFLLIVILLNVSSHYNHHLRPHQPPYLVVVKIIFSIQMF